MTKSKKSLNWKNILFVFLSVLAIIIIFFVLDYLVHSLSNEYAVPDYYFRNKIIFGTFWALIIYYFIRKLTILRRSLILSAFISIVLQTRYYLEGYPLKFVLEFLIFHFIMLLVASLIIFNLMKKKLNVSS